MRRTMDPPPSTRCERCKGELKLKRADVGVIVSGLDSHVFACSDCGTERSFVARQDLYAARSSFSRPSLRA